MTLGVASTRKGVPALLVDPMFGPFFLGKMVSSAGIWIQNLAASVLMYELTRSPFMVGMVTVAQFGASTFLPLWSGALTDRVNRAHIILLGRVVSAVAVMSLGVALMRYGTAGFGGPSVLLAAVTVMGVGLGLSSPAMQAIVPALVARENLESALALSSSAPSAARAVGPVVGAWLLLTVDFGAAFLVAGVTHLAFAGILLTVRVDRPNQTGARPALLGGLRYVLTDTAVGRKILAVAVIGIGADPVVTLTPAIADELGGDAGTVGYLAAGFGAGSIALTVALGMLRRRLTLGAVGFAGFLVIATGMVAVAVSDLLALSIAGFVLAGFGYMMSSVALNTRIQAQVPDELRGRVMALFMIAFLGSRPIGAAMNGGIAEAFTVTTALLTLATTLVAASVLALPRGTLTRRGRAASPGTGTNELSEGKPGAC